MRTAIYGFISATLYTFAIATLFAMSMPSQADLQAYIEATRKPIAATTLEVIDAEAAH